MDRLFQFTPYEGSPVQAWFNVIAQYMSPYDLNPLNINPLHDRSSASSISTRCARARKSRCSSPRPTCTPAAAHFPGTQDPAT